MKMRNGIFQDKRYRCFQSQSFDYENSVFFASQKIFFQKIGGNTLDKLRRICLKTQYIDIDKN